MTTYTGSQPVQPGFYLNTKRLSITSMEKIGPLPGTARDTFYRVPMLAMLAAAPLLGLAYVMFLPLIGFAMVIYLLGHKAALMITNAATEGARVLRPSWAPALAYLTRSKPAKRTGAAGNPADAWSEEIERKLGDDKRRES